MSKAPSSTNKQKSGQKSSKVARTSDDSDDGSEVDPSAINAEKRNAIDEDVITPSNKVTKRQ